MLARPRLQVPQGVASLLVEMNRTSGDPVLFVEPAAAGFRAGALPTVSCGVHSGATPPVCCSTTLLSADSTAHGAGAGLPELHRQRVLS